MIPLDTSDPKDRRRHLRASAWYCVGYEKGKVAFAWLGAVHMCIDHETDEEQLKLEDMTMQLSIL